MERSKDDPENESDQPKSTNAIGDRSYEENASKNQHTRSNYGIKQNNEENRNQRYWTHHLEKRTTRRRKAKPTEEQYRKNFRDDR